MSIDFEQRLALNPALIVGLGGTGKKIVSNFKQIFLSSPQIREIFQKANERPKFPDFIELLCIDTDLFDTHEKPDIEGAKLTEEEYHQINIQNANQITGNLDTDTYSYLHEWFPVKLKHYIGQISQGAHQFRFTGRFGLFVDIQKIYQTIKSKISNIIARSNVNQDDLIIPLTNKQGQISTPEFYVIGSLCGGSGAGMVIDIAYLLKMAYYQISGGKNKPSIVGILLTPEAFNRIAIDPNINATGRIEANGYATLAEIFYFMYKEKFPPSKSAKEILMQDRRNKFMVNYGPIGKSHDSTTFGSVSEEPPFDQCYLVGTSSLDDLPTYNSIVAEFIFTKLATNLRQAQNSMLDNASQILGQLSSDLEGKQLKCFSTLGLKSFFYPIDLILELYTYKLSLDITYWLKLSSCKTTIDQMVSDFLESDPSKLDLTPEGLLELSKKIISRKQYWDNPMYHTMRTEAAQLPKESATAYIQRKIDEMEKNRVKKDEIKMRVRVAFEKAANDASKHIKAKIIDIINDPDLGALIAVDFLNSLEKAINRIMKDSLVRKDEELKNKQLKAQLSYVEKKDKLTAKINSLFGLGGKLLEIGSLLSLTNLNDEYTSLEQSAKEVVDYEYERFCLTAVIDYLKFLLNNIQNIKKQVEEFVRKLDQIYKDGYIQRAYEDCLEKIKPYSPVQKFVETYIFEERDIEPYYKYILSNLTSNDIERYFLIEINLAKNWDAYTNPESNSLQDDIINFSRNFISKRIIGGIEEFIHWKDSVRKGFKKSLIESLMNQSAPLLTINDRGNNQPARMNIITLGIHDENSPLAIEIKETLQKAGLGVTIAPTRNKYNLTLVQTLHGVCPYNISSITQWHSLYRKNNAKINCHAILTNDGYPILWSSYGLIPAKTLEQLYLVYVLLRYEIYANAEKKVHGIEYNNELVQFELYYQQDKPQPIGRTVIELFDYLKNNTMGIYLINSVYKEYWLSLPLPQQYDFVKKYRALFQEKVRKLEEEIEQEIRTYHEVSVANDELLSIKRGILRIMMDLEEQYEKIFMQRPKTL